ncbi:hypothetical protein Misp01_01840 [Microtetraspora sp. NBRC 13810]|nr:hypothetical protein [Microtetraspora sp. NBRC 13810]GLW05054.1 hypothetical protein Misp01_01840 [Microtetraspora sp. NBRC 13810]
MLGGLATAGGLILTGALLWWLGTVWPHRTPETPVVTRRPER